MDNRFRLLGAALRLGPEADMRLHAASMPGRQCGEVSGIASGVWRVRLVEPERFVPTAFRPRRTRVDRIDALPESGSG